MHAGKMNCIALAGGVGGAKLADGLAQVLQPEQLTIIVNTGDDFTHLGLRISPDLDTVCYTLAGLANPKTGWGRHEETWHVFENLKKMGMADWFQLGDADLATHLVRTMRLDEGIPLSQITADFCAVWGVKDKVLPMSDDLVHTWVRTEGGELEFQEYFVHRQAKPVVLGFRFEGVAKSRPAPGVMEAIDGCDMVIICPSNPWVSIDPILSIPGVRAAIEKKPVYAVSPIIGNSTVKGPAAKMFSELGILPSALAVAQHYGHLLHGIWIDKSDSHLVGDITKIGIPAYLADILMRDRQDRGRLAGEIINNIRQTMRG